MSDDRETPVDRPRRPRRVTSTTWKGLTDAARADIWASEYFKAGEHGELAGIAALEQLFGVYFSTESYPALRALITAAFLAGSERASALQLALDAEHAIRLRLELRMREMGEAVPTDARPSEPPVGT